MKYLIRTFYVITFFVKTFCFARELKEKTLNCFFGLKISTCESRARRGPSRCRWRRWTSPWSAARRSSAQMETPTEQNIKLLLFIWQRRWGRGRVLACGDERPGFESRFRLNFFLSSHLIFYFNFLWPQPSIDLGLFFSHLFPLLLSLSFFSCVVCKSQSLIIFLPSSSLLNSYASCAKITNGLSVSIHYPLPTGTKLSEQNWCSVEFFYAN